MCAQAHLLARGNIELSALFVEEWLDASSQKRWVQTQVAGSPAAAQMAILELSRPGMPLATAAYCGFAPAEQRAQEDDDAEISYASRV